MVRLLAQLVLNVLANAVGLLFASLIVTGFSISGVSFVIAVAIFSVTEVVLDPLLTKIAITNVPALRGGVALVTTLVSLIITSLVSDGISIDGLNAWVLGTLFVWLFSLLATLVLPLFLFKKTLQKVKNK